MPHCNARKAGRTLGRNVRAFSCSSHSRPSSTWWNASAAVLLDCSPISCKSSERSSPCASDGMATTNGASSASPSMAAATTKPLLRRLVTQCSRPSSCHPPRLWRPRTCRLSMPERNFMALDSPVAPASSPVNRRGNRRSRSGWLGLCSRYSMKARWPQQTNAAANERLAMAAIASTASLTCPPVPPWAGSTPTRSTCASAMCARTRCGSHTPWSIASALASSHCRNAGSSMSLLL